MVVIAQPTIPDRVGAGRAGRPAPSIPRIGDTGRSRPGRITPEGRAPAWADQFGDQMTKASSEPGWGATTDPTGPTVPGVHEWRVELGSESLGSFAAEPALTRFADDLSRLAPGAVSACSLTLGRFGMILAITAPGRRRPRTREPGCSRASSRPPSGRDRFPRRSSPATWWSCPSTTRRRTPRRTRESSRRPRRRRREADRRS